MHSTTGFRALVHGPQIGISPSQRYGGRFRGMARRISEAAYYLLSPNDTSSVCRFGRKLWDEAYLHDEHGFDIVRKFGCSRYGRVSCEDAGRMKEVSARGFSSSKILLLIPSSSIPRMKQNMHGGLKTRLGRLATLSARGNQSRCRLSARLGVSITLARHPAGSSMTLRVHRICQVFKSLGRIRTVSQLYPLMLVVYIYYAQYMIPDKYLKGIWHLLTSRCHMYCIHTEL
jgi:hypothetical protein